MNTDGVVIQSKSLFPNKGYGKLLLNGSQVLVRVIADKGSGRYEGSVAGTKVNITSQKPLVAGSVFKAKIQEKNGIIQLIPENKVETQAANTLQLVDNKAILNLLRNLGLSGDEIYINLLKQLKQMEIRYDPEFMSSIKKKAEEFKGREKKASQILTILKEKNISATKEEILYLLEEIEEKKFEQEEEFPEKKFELLNRINSTKGKWFLLPYEISQKSEENEEKDWILGKGCIKVLLINDKLKKLNLNCNLRNSVYMFYLEFSENQLERIYMNISDVSESKQEDTVNTFRKFFENQDLKTEVFWAEKDLLEGTGCLVEDIYSFEGEI